MIQTDVPLTQDVLLDVAVERIRAVRPELWRRLDLSTPAALHAARSAIVGTDTDGGTTADTVVTCVVAAVDLPRWVRDTCRFALGLTKDESDTWQRAFTRTVFLAGQPENLRQRFTFHTMAADGSAAWTTPAPEATTTTLRRLLKTFSGHRELEPWEPTTVSVPTVGEAGVAEPNHRVLYVATEGVTVSGALVHVNHLLVEAVFAGLIAPGDRLTLRSTPRLTRATERFAALRVDGDADQPPSLRAYAGLTEGN